jgi:N-acetylglucosamine kinase-like BadF-type ATPase
MHTEILLLGIDGGASKTEACLAASTPGTEPQIVGRATAGPSNPHAVGFDTALKNLDLAIAGAFRSADIPIRTVAAAVLGLAGSDRDETRLRLTHWADQRHVAHRFRIVHDAHPVLAAGSPDGWGVALISGTGSLAFGRAPDGRACRAGGWGFLLGDEGSGFAIARAALRSAAQASEGRGPDTGLLPAFLKRFQLREPLELITAISPLADNRAAIAALSDVVIDAADRGDAVAGAILDQAASDLAAMVASAARRLGFSEPFPLALSGGVLTTCEGLRRRLSRAIPATGVNVASTCCITDPVLGAVKLAADLSAAT